MPRRSYEAHRAARLTPGRRPSVIESETDAESMASYTTWNSSTSYLTGPSQSGAPSPRRQVFAPSHLGREVSSSSTPRLAVGAESERSSPAPSGHLGVPDSRRKDDPAREERRRRRAERRAKSTLAGEKYDSPLRRWARWMSANGLSAWSLPIGLAAVGVVKTAVGYGGFSGKDTPPMYGDFEAQRHWMEITIHRSMAEWYTYAPEWWLLDYPPLTAYASWLCGKIGSFLNPENFALDTSYGRSPPDLVTFMRFSVLAFEGCIWWSAVGAWMILQGRKEGRSWRSQMTGIMTILLQPSLMLIDNGHFQYNSVLLGVSLWALVLLTHDYDLLACIAFSCALCFKQMGLYYAPAIGCYLLGKCFWLGGAKGLLHFVKLGIATASTFLILFAPWLRPFPSAIGQVVHRIFPFARGIFEDKVANFWCATNVVIKWRRWFDVTGMARLASIATLASLIPLVSIIMYTSLAARPEQIDQSKSNGISSEPIPLVKTPRSPGPPPTVRLLPMAMVTSSLGFFLFSFQVHEKSILLPLMPLTILMAFRGGKELSSTEDELWGVGVLVNNVSAFSMWPLLKRDNQALQYVYTNLLWNYITGYSPTATQPALLRQASYLIYLCIGALHLPDLFPELLPVPARFPDLYVVLNVFLSFGVFGLAWLWSLKKLFESAWAIGGLGVDLHDKRSRLSRLKVD